MAIYNIIYTAPDDNTYLWNGSSFDLLNKEENDKLFFSGKSYNEDEVTQAMLKSREVVRHVFPDDREPKIEKVEIPVNDKDTEGGHHHKMTT